MKNRWKGNPLFRMFLFFSGLVLLAVVVGISLYYYVFSIPEPEGLSLANWPSRFTSNFTAWMVNDHGTIQIEDIGLERLDDPVFRMVMVLVFCVAAAWFLIYGFWLTRQMGKIIRAIGNISSRTYQPSPEEGIFGSIYTALNKMDLEIRRSDQLKEDTERVRREWIANITHDLKTPLSPVKGYAELLADGAATEGDTVQEYGSIILKNVNHVEKLMNDLKLTYQLESGAFPFRLQRIRLVRCLKEWAIDIVNDPAFSDRVIEFESNLPELFAAIDPDLFRRAVQNLVVNALIHNPLDVKVTISVTGEQEGSIYISIKDNGVGMGREEQAELFNRYYRGTNTKEKPEGSGLGLAIAKQIITLHGGDIVVESKPGEGTEFSIQIPAN